MLVVHNAKAITTDYLKDEIERCEDVEEFRNRILPLLDTQREQWKKKIQEIILDSGLSKSEFASLCGVSRVAVNKWCGGAIPKNRETFLRIGLVAGYDRVKFNQLLQRYGRHPGLYSKQLEDCICMFVMSKNYGDESSGKYIFILEKMKERLRKAPVSDINGTITSAFDEKLSQVREEDELEGFIKKNTEVFLDAYHALYTYIDMLLKINVKDEASSISNLADGQGWSSSLRQAVSAIGQRKWFPTRNKIISIGLHLGLEREKIDGMLKLAYMEPLCAKNIFESVVIFILEQAEVMGMFHKNLPDYEPDMVCRYAKKVMQELKLPEVEFFLSEVMEID